MLKNRILFIFSFFVLTTFMTTTVIASPFGANDVHERDRSEWNMGDWLRDDRRDDNGTTTDDTEVRTGTLMGTDEEVESIPIRVDVKPDDELNQINLANDESIDVVLFGSTDFDVRNIDKDSITLNGVSHDGNVEFVDQNNDGIDDLMLTFSTADLDLDEGINSVTVEGETKDGESFLGDDRVMISSEDDTLLRQM